MEILIILAVVYYSILLFKQCSSKATLLKRLQEPDKHPVFKTLVNWKLASMLNKPVPSVVHGFSEGDVCWGHAAKIKEKMGFTKDAQALKEAFWAEVKTITADELEVMTAEVNRVQKTNWL